MTPTSVYSIAFGLANKNRHGEIIEAYYPTPLLNPPVELISQVYNSLALDPAQKLTIELDDNQSAVLRDALAGSFQDQAQLIDQLSQGKGTPILCILHEDSAPESVAEVYLKLQLLSHRLALPNSLNLDGAFGLLHNLAWTNKGPVPLDELPARQLESRLAGELLEVMSVDKFPKMTNYVVPPGVRIAHTARVRLGAYVGEGTTVMHEGFVNFNAGSAGKAMIEGRISASVMVGEGSDLGGGCSIMGTLSGGGSEVITVGENCLIGANAGIGFSIGNRCIIEAGLYVTAGTKVNVLDRNGELAQVAKARDLSRVDDLLFRRNSLSGAVECVPNKATIALNDDLHSHN